jgi:hypothetical protein
MEGSRSAVVPWHLSVNVTEMGRDVSFAGLMFEHTRMMIRYIAMKYQFHSFPERLYTRNYSRLNQMLEDLAMRLMEQTNDWKPALYELLSRNTGLEPDEIVGKVKKEIVGKVEEFAELLLEHINIVFTYTNAIYGGNERIANEKYQELYQDNTNSIVLMIDSLTPEGTPSFLSIWKDHLDCTVAYIMAGATTDNEAFDREASKCIEISAGLGSALDRAVGGEGGGRSYSMRSSSEEKPSKGERAFSFVF